MDLVFWLFWLGAVEDFEEVGRPAAHARVQVGLWRREQGKVSPHSKTARDGGPFHALEHLRW